MQHSAKSTDAKRPRGRPRIADQESRQVVVRLPDGMLAAIDAIAAARLDRPDRSQVIREMLAAGIKAAGGRP